MKLTAAYLHSQLSAYSASANIIVGYSGGVDSHVLLHLLANIPELKSKITAVYIHHGLQHCADDWALECQQVAQVLAVNFRVIKVNAQATQGESPEEAARNARYQAFKKILTENDVLLFAQHRNDQLETVLLQLFRGAGLKGLSGMPTAIDFAEGMLVRPLLDVCQEDITDYAQQHNLQWVEDPSNQDMRYERNYLRQKIIPLLEQHWPGLDKTVARVAGHCAQAQAELSATTRVNMLALYDPVAQCLSLKGLLEHDDLTKQSIIREWMSHLAVRMPTQKLVTAILRDILPARVDANPLIQHDGLHVRRYRDHLYLVRDQKKPDLSQVIFWEKCLEPLSLPENGLLTPDEVDQGKGIARDVWLHGKIHVQYRQGGEKIALAHRKGRHSLKKLYQEAAIAPWQREEIPLIYIDGELAAIADYWVNAEIYVKDQACISLQWK